MFPSRCGFMCLLLKAKWVCHRISVTLTPIWNITAQSKSVLDLTDDPTQIELLKGDGYGELRKQKKMTTLSSVLKLLSFFFSSKMI